MCGGLEGGGVGGRVGRGTVEVVALFTDVVGVGAQGGVDLGGVGALGFDEGVVGGEAAGGEGVLDGTGWGDAGGTDEKRTLISAQENFRAACGPWVRAREVGRRLRKGRSARESIVSSEGVGTWGCTSGFLRYQNTGFPGSSLCKFSWETRQFYTRSRLWFVETVFNEQSLEATPVVQSNEVLPV